MLVIAGAPEMPGAALLAATAALRGGAGKLTVGSAASIAVQLGVALPEARVIGMADTAEGGFSIDGARALLNAAGHADAVLIGPGMRGAAAIAELVHALLPHCAGKPLIFDAAAMAVVRTPWTLRFPARRY